VLTTLRLLSRRSIARAADSQSAAQLGVGEAARVLELTDAADEHHRSHRDRQAAAFARRCRGGERPVADLARARRRVRRSAREPAVCRQRCWSIIAAVCCVISALMRVLLFRETGSELLDAGRSLLS
jgi:hypothetical protein